MPQDFFWPPILPKLHLPLSLKPFPMIFFPENYSIAVLQMGKHFAVTLRFIPSNLTVHINLNMAFSYTYAIGLRFTNTADFTPLIFASYHGNTSLVRTLLEMGADINAVDRNGWTALHWAAQQNRVEVTCILLRNGANRRTKDCLWADSRAPSMQDAAFVSKLWRKDTESVIHGIQFFQYRYCFFKKKKKKNMMMTMTKR
ncbi:unnamed protein product [Rodentolepis nana]|uniref:ANK_REP_REGION domain-containing protein n=1 Tax=Rodentolepis nana TaxID=102285 RepID=A0A0R3T7L1_RODNA|nr:unnamed protein product [Rodentolepis nana]